MHQQKAKLIDAAEEGKEEIMMSLTAWRDPEFRVIFSRLCKLCLPSLDLLAVMRFLTLRTRCRIEGFCGTPSGMSCALLRRARLRKQLILGEIWPQSTYRSHQPCDYYAGWKLILVSLGMVG